jgi:hypothetical protein
MAEGEHARRSFGDDVRTPERAAAPKRSFADKILMRVSRFAPAGLAPAPTPAPVLDRPQFDLSAPLSSLFSSRESEIGSEGFSLSFLLRESANAIERGKYMLGDRAREVSSAIAGRRDGELMLVTQGFRLLIALLWLFLGMTLDRQALAAAAAGAQSVSGMPLGDAQIIARIFLVIGGIGAIAAFLGGFLVNLTGKASNLGVRRAAANLGAEAADLAKRFDAALDSLRVQMDRRGDRADAVEDLSRMHVTALEAASFFQGVQFLTDPDRGNAAAKFRAYLRDHASFGGSGGASPVIALLLGVVVGLALGYGAWAPPAAPVPDAPIVVSPLFAYPSVTIAALGGAVLFVAAGGLLGAFAGPVTASAGESARDEALDAVRGAFVAGNAPRIEDVIRRIEDALAVYKARLGGGGTSAHHGAGGADKAALDDTPSWRRPPEGPRFVAPSFDAAPKAFLADAPKTTKGSAGGFLVRKPRSEAAPKQGFGGPETPPWLKD